MKINACAIKENEVTERSVGSNPKIWAVCKHLNDTEGYRKYLEKGGASSIFILNPNVIGSVLCTDCSLEFGTRMVSIISKVIRCKSSEKETYILDFTEVSDDHLKELFCINKTFHNGLTTTDNDVTLNNNSDWEICNCLYKKKNPFKTISHRGPVIQTGKKFYCSDCSGEEELEFISVTNDEFLNNILQRLLKL